MSFVGGKMIWEAIKGDDNEKFHASSLGWKNLFVMSIATSIDALTVGATFAVMPREGLLALSYGYLLSCALIACVTFVICIGGVVIGCRFGNVLGKNAEIVGGIVLILIGCKILVEHTFLS
jgi:putative Mn2+ efflux pump MntP